MGIVIRKACEADAEQIGMVQYRAWMETYTGLLPKIFLSVLGETTTEGVESRK